jgi:hypothetical protein
MLKNILNMLQSDSLYGVSHNIDIAKGKYKIPQSMSEAKAQIKLIWKSKR